jgi:hypothetical protein
MKVELKAEVTKTGNELPVVQITDLSGQNLTPRREPEACLAIAASLEANVRRTAMKDTPTGRAAAKALIAFGLAGEDDGDDEETSGDEEEEQEPAGARARRGAKTGA